MIVEEKLSLRKQASKGIIHLISKRKELQREICNQVVEMIKFQFSGGERQIILTLYFLHFSLKELPSDQMVDLTYEAIRALKKNNDEISTHVYLTIAVYCTFFEICIT